MFKIFVKNGSVETCIYNDIAMMDNQILVSPKLELTENSAGQFTAKVPPTNVGYNLLERIYTIVIVQRKNKEIWRGRILTIKEDFQKNKSITCEGELSYLNDTIQEQEIYEDKTNRQVLQYLLNIHNGKVSEEKRFNVGAFTKTYTIEEAITNYDSTLTAINKLIVEPYGGYISITKNNNGQKQINYTEDPNRPTSSQVIRFAENLLDFTKNYDSTDFCTVVLPLGARVRDQYGISTSGIDGVEAYRTLEDEYGSPYLVNEDTVSRFGRIEKIIKFSDIDDEVDLHDAALDYLTNLQFDNMTLECGAVDLSYMDVNVEELHLSEKVRVISRPHGLDRFFPITRISIPIDNPANTTFQMGSVVTNSLTTQSNVVSKDIRTTIDEIPTESEVLINARSNADKLINSFNTGYVTLTQRDNGSQELYITDVKIADGYDPNNPAAAANRYWRWNLNGLAYYNKNSAAYNNWGNPNYKEPGANGLKLAFTMDGHIVADCVTVGSMFADRIRGGTLALGGKSTTIKNGELVIYNASDSEIGRWDYRGISIQQGSIKLTKTGWNDASHSGVYIGSEGIRLGVNNIFQVTAAGALTATSATITGSITAKSGRIGADSNGAGGWLIEAYHLSSGTLGADASMHLATTNLSGTVATNNRSDWRLTVGSHFGVTNTGKLYCNDVDIKGRISASGGDIGGFTINTNDLTVGNAKLSKDEIGCGYAGKGIAILVGNRDSNNARYGYVQVSNSGNFDSCLDGVRIYGNGRVVGYGGGGNEEWVRYLSNIPTS